MNKEEFENLVKYYFQNVISENGMKVETIGDSVSCYVRLYNEYCEVFVSKDYEDILVEIWIPNKGNERYNLMTIFKVLYPEEKVKIEFQNEDSNLISKNLRLYSFVIQRIVPRILNGNSEWVQEYQIYENNSRQILKTLGKDFKPSHPIFQKFLNRDESWKDDLANYSIGG